MTDTGLLYHYTDVGGMLGVVQNRTLWATDTNFLNDTQERTFANSALEEAARLAKVPGFDEEVMADQLYGRAVLGFAQSRLRNLYVVCFSAHSDLLGLWRAYGKDQGYAIGFDKEALEKLPSPWQDETPPTLREVTYGASDELRDEIRDYLSSLNETPTAHPGVMAQYSTWLEEKLATVKHPAFADERETRLVYGSIQLEDLSPDDEGKSVVRFRRGKFSVVPYLEVKWPREALKKIVIGPGAHWETRMAGLQRLLACHGLPDVRVEASTMPLRE
ncbi:MAG: DUF2971 domain-containing protein [Polyangiaceae bacterium]|nr:DUF2971 domain-containing protein [Polyangiaceae bacterium]